MTNEENKVKIEALEERIKRIEMMCCSIESIEDRTKTNILLEQSLNKLREISKKVDDTEAVLLRHDRYFYILIGVAFAISFFDIDEKIKVLIGG